MLGQRSAQHSAGTTGCTRPAVEMPGLNSAVYQISSVAGLPSVLPQMLKEFAKAAIRTQPHDLLVWSRDYFRSLSSGTHPPEKERWEDSSAAGGITTGLLRLLNKQVSLLFVSFIQDGSDIRYGSQRIVRNIFFFLRRRAPSIFARQRAKGHVFGYRLCEMSDV